MNYFKTQCILMSALLFWASAFVGIKIGLMSYSPGALALLRFLIASLCLALAYFFQRNQPQMTWWERIQLLLAGMAGIGIYHLCLNYGEVTVSAGIASFIIGLMPVMTAVLSLFFLKERLRGGSWFGILVSMLGLLLMATGEGARAETKQGMMLLLISAFMSALLTIIEKRFLIKHSSTTVISWVIWGGTLLLLFYTPDLIRQLPYADYKATAVVVYMGIFPAAVAYFAWTYVLQQLSASKAAVTLYALPFISTLLAYWILGEQPSVLSLMGGIVALSGAVIARYFQEQESAAAVLDKEVVAA